jgi:hypothetical protein
MFAHGGRHEQFDRRPAATNRVSQPEPIHRSRHVDVRKDQPNVRAEFEYFDCLVGSGGRKRLETTLLCDRTATIRTRTSSSTTRMTGFPLVIVVPTAARRPRTASVEGLVLVERRQRPIRCRELSAFGRKGEFNQWAVPPCHDTLLFVASARSYAASGVP